MLIIADSVHRSATDRDRYDYRYDAEVTCRRIGPLNALGRRSRSGGSQRARSSRLEPPRTQEQIQRSHWQVLSSLAHEQRTGGEGEIRTLETLITSVRFRGGCLQPLDHLSAAVGWDSTGVIPSYACATRRSKEVTQAGRPIPVPELPRYLHPVVSRRRPNTSNGAVGAAFRVARSVDEPLIRAATIAPAHITQGSLLT